MQSKPFSDYSELCHFVKKFGVNVDHNFEKVTKKIFALVDSRVLPIKTVTIDALLEINSTDLIKIRGVGSGYAFLLDEMQKNFLTKILTRLKRLMPLKKSAFLEN
jgi:hypothetical protein